jgi:hypothetical protein
VETNSYGVSIQNKVLPKVEAVVLRRKSDGQIFNISSPCIMRIASGLVQVVGGPSEELDTNIWDTTAKFEVIKRIFFFVCHATDCLRRP